MRFEELGCEVSRDHGNGRKEVRKIDERRVHSFPTFGSQKGNELDDDAYCFFFLFLGMTASRVNK